MPGEPRVYAILRRPATRAALQIFARAVTAEPWEEATARLVHRVQGI